jgi:hypothetical protein
MPPIHTAAVSAFHPRTARVDLRAYWWDFAPPPQLFIEVQDDLGNQDYIPLQNTDWKEMGPSDAAVIAGVAIPGHGTAYVAKEQYVGPVPGRLYQATLVSGQAGPQQQRYGLSAEFTMPPYSLPLSDDAHSPPLRLLLGSCLSPDGDRFGELEGLFDRLWQNPATRPHYVVLCGDQVYIDQPAGPFGPFADEGLKGKAALEKWVCGAYIHSWSHVPSLYRFGIHIHVTDDHEYWNNYPRRPTAAGWPILGDESVRNRLRTITRRWAEYWQGTREVYEINIGTPRQLSLIFVDARFNREANNKRFMSSDGFSRVIRWIEGLSSPGVLTISQPIFAPKVGVGYIPKTRIAWDRKADINLASFDQYLRLSKALALADHDVLVLSGDVHFGRVAAVRIPRTDRPDPTWIREVISSPVCCLPTATGKFTSAMVNPGPNGVRNDYYPDVFPAVFDIQGRYAPARIVYGAEVETRQDVCRNHVMTLSFSAGIDGGVDVAVNDWLMDGGVNGRTGLPRGGELATFNLDGGRLTAPGGRGVRYVTHTVRDRKWRIVGLANPKEHWSPRTRSEVVDDLVAGRCRYFARRGNTSVEIQTVRIGALRFLRTKPDGKSSNNLRSLPVTTDRHIRW